MDTITVQSREGDYIDVCITHVDVCYETKFWFNQTLEEWKRFFADCKSKPVASLTAENMGTYLHQEICYNREDLLLYSHNVSARIKLAQTFLADMEKVVLDV